MKSIFYSLFSLIFFQGIAQTFSPSEQHQIDSINAIINNPLSHDTDLASAYGNLSIILYVSNIDTIIPLCSKSIRIAEKSLTKNPTAKVTKSLKNSISDALNNIGYAYMDKGDFSQALKYFHKSLKIYEETKNKKGIGDSYNNIGMVYDYHGDSKLALKYYHKSLKVYKEIRNKKLMAGSYNNIGFIHKSMGDIALALEYYHKCLKIFEELGDKRGMATSYSNIGTIHYKQENFILALAYYKKGLIIREELGDKKGVAQSLSNIGSIYKIQKELLSALENFQKSLKIQEEIEDKQGMATSFYNIAIIHQHKNELSIALGFYNKGLKIFEEIGDKQGIVNSLSGIGKVELLQGAIKPAQEKGVRALKYAKEIGFIDQIKYSAGLLYEVAQKQKNWQEALVMRNLEIQMRDSIASDENMKAIANQQAKYEYEKQKALDDAENEKLIVIEQEAKEKQQVITYATGTGLGLVGIFLFFVINRLKVTRKQKGIIEKAHHSLEEKNKEIMDSIIYAKRIQSAILPPQKVVKEYLPESFILYKPKDIVAGDFYWMEHKDGKVLFAACDCTGHGVPGAMVSVVCNNGLNRSVREHGLTDPGEILNKTREIVVQEFEKSDEEVKDGMDIALCSLEFKVKSLEFDKEQHETQTELASSTKLNQNRACELNEVKLETAAILQYSGANNPLWIIRPSVIANATASPDFSGKQSLQNKQIAPLPLTVRNDGNFELIEITANKQPIGKFDNPEPYTTHTLELQKGDSIYIFSDGYVDQFGGEKGKKFKAKAFRELLLSIQDKSMEQQRILIDVAFETWKGNVEQVDDVCIIGVRI